MTWETYISFVSNVFHCLQHGMNTESKLENGMKIVLMWSMMFCTEVSPHSLIILNREPKTNTKVEGQTTERIRTQRNE